MFRTRQVLAFAALSALAATASAKLPPPSPEAQAKAAETKAKADHAAKVDAYKLCLSQDKTAAHYLKDAKAKGKDVKPMPAGACADPGPFQPPVVQAAAAPAPAAPAAAPAAAAAPKK